MLTEWLLGASFVTAHTYRRYNSPQTNRSSTTTARFYTYFILYLVASLLLYMIFCIFADSPGGKENLYRFAVGSPSASLPEYIADLSGPIAIALFMTTLLPSLPILSKLDGKILDVFWQQGRIPFKIKQQIDALCHAEFKLNPGLMRKITEYIQDQEYHFSLNDMNVQEPDSLDNMWIKSTLIIDHLSKWDSSSNKGYRKFLIEFEEEYQANIEKHKILSLRYDSYKQIYKSNRNNENNSLYNELEKSLDKDLESFYRKIVEFLIRGMNYSQYFEVSHQKELSELGFQKIDLNPDSVPYDTVLKIAAIITGSFFTLSLVQHFINQESRALYSLIFETLLMTVSFGLAVMTATSLKRWPMFVINNITRSRPWFGYIVTAVVSAALWCFSIVMIRLCFGYFTTDNSMQLLEKVGVAISWSYPYFLLSSTLAVSTAFTIDSYLKIRGPSTQRIVVVDTICVAIPMLAASFFVFAWLEGKYLFEGFGTKSPQWRGDTSMTWFLIKNTVVGIIVGFSIPNIYRANRSKAPQKHVSSMIQKNHEQLIEEANQLQPDQLKEALCNIAASVAKADGTPDRFEENVFKYSIKPICSWPCTGFNQYEAMQCYRQKVEQQDFDLSALKDLKGFKRLPTLLANIALAVADADGDFADKEKQQIEKILEILQLKPESFDLRVQRKTGY